MGWNDATNEYAGEITWEDQEEGGIGWFAIDTEGLVAAFHSGLGPIHPSARRAGHEMRSRIWADLMRMPSRLAGIPDTQWLRGFSKAEYKLVSDFALKDAKTYGSLGLFEYLYPRACYSEDECGMPYKRRLIATDPITMSAFPAVVRAYLASVTLDTSFRFSHEVPTDLIADPVYQREKDL